MDQTLLTIISIVLGGAGLFTVLTHWNVPEASHSFYGNNPFLIKREAISNAVDWVFASLAATALVLQLGAVIVGDDLAPRLHDREFYIYASAVVLVATTFIVFLLTGIAKAFARRKWLKDVVAAQASLFADIAFIVANNGLAQVQAAEAAKYKPEQLLAVQKQNAEFVSKNLSQIEVLLEKDGKGTTVERVAALTPFFGAN